MMKRCRLHLARLLLVLAAALAAASSPLRAQSPESEERSVYVSAVDKAGKPVTTLSPSDFVVREGGMTREVLRVQPASEPAQIALLVDTSATIEPNVGDMRRALERFFKEVGGRHEVALIAYGERPTVLVDYTRDVKRLQSGLGMIFPRANSGTELLDAIVEAARGLQLRKAERPVIVVFNARGQEFGERSHQSVIDALRPIPVALHALVLARRGTPSPLSADERQMQELEQSIAEGTRLTGGRREELLTTMALGDQLHALLEEIDNQYKLTYARPKTLIPPETLEVTSKRPEITIRARRVP
jgi:Ca-activated chloride channel family protein